MCYTDRIKLNHTHKPNNTLHSYRLPKEQYEATAAWPRVYKVRLHWDTLYTACGYTATEVDTNVTHSLPFYLFP